MTDTQLGVIKQQTERVINEFRKPQWLYVIPYNAPWYELLLTGKLLIKTESGKFGVKTGSMPKKHRGWVGFYNSKARVRKEVVERHGLSVQNLHLGALVGVGYLENSRTLTSAEKFQWYLRANKIKVTDFESLYRRHVHWDPKKLSPEDKVEFFYDMLHRFLSDPIIIAGPMDVGHFYRPETLKRFLKPIPVKYPSGPVTGTKLAITPDTHKALQEVGVTL